MKRSNFFSIIFIVIFLVAPLGAQWAKSYYPKKASGSAYVKEVRQASHGGYIACGAYFSSTNAYEGLIFKLDGGGILEWQNDFSGPAQDWMNSVWPARDGGYIVGGTTSSGALILKLDALGRIEWQLSHGWYSDEILSVIQTSDGGFAALVSAMGHPLFVKLSAFGTVQWQFECTGPGLRVHTPATLRQTREGGYVVAVSAGLDYSNYDVWIFKLNAQGNFEWQEMLGGPLEENVASLEQTVDGGFIFSGMTLSFGAGNHDIWVVRLTAAGDVAWQRTYGTSRWEEAHAVAQTQDGGFIVACTLNSGYDFSLLKLQPNGDVEWGRTYGGTGGGPVLGWVTSLLETSDGGFVTACGSSDFKILVLKIRNDGLIDADCKLAVTSVQLAAMDSTAVPKATYAIPSLPQADWSVGNISLQPIELSARLECGHESGSGKKGSIRR